MDEPQVLRVEVDEQDLVLLHEDMALLRWRMPFLAKTGLESLDEMPRVYIDELLAGAMSAVCNFLNTFAFHGIPDPGKPNSRTVSLVISIEPIGSEEEGYIAGDPTFLIELRD